MLNDSKKSYGVVSRVFHWLMALLIGSQLFKLGDRINDGEHWLGETVVPWHISVGGVLLVLIVLRIFWVLRQRQHRPQHDGATTMLIKGGHVLLYGAMLLMPITGMLYMIGNGYGLKFFGVRLVERGPEIDWALCLGSFHSPIAWLLVALVAGHIVAALYHYIKRDGVMKSM